MTTYRASDIEVLEGLEGIRRRPGMYIGGTDVSALHHLVEEVLDNAMDEVVAGHATRIRVTLHADGGVSVQDNGRGIPVDPHPRYPDKSALEVVLTTLHSGGKFGSAAYATAGGLHGVGVSVVSALSVQTEVTVERDGFVWRQSFSRGKPVGPLITLKPSRGHGTRVFFQPDSLIFPDCQFQFDRLQQMCRVRSCLIRGVIIDVIREASGDREAVTERFHFPDGVLDFLRLEAPPERWLAIEPFHGSYEAPAGAWRMEWAITWLNEERGRTFSYCNTIATPLGGSHEAGLRSAVLRSIREWIDARNLLPRGLVLVPEDILGAMASVLSLFIPDPQFSGQTKEKLTSPGVDRQVDAALKDRLDHWLNGRTERTQVLVEAILERARDRVSRKKESASTVKRKSATSRLTLPGKLTDCVATDLSLTELFIVEGDSAGGSAKQARDRHTQAVLPLRGKILNVEQANLERFEQNTEIQNLITAIGTGCGNNFDLSGLRYGRIIVMTDADVDGAHIASLLLTFFYRFMNPLVHAGHLFLAQPPLYRISHGGTVTYALDDAEKERVLQRLASKRGNVDVSRFKGLGEMDPPQLRETTMSVKSRRLLRVYVDDRAVTDDTFDRLMGKRPSERFRFIQERASFVRTALDF